MTNKYGERLDAEDEAREALEHAALERAVRKLDSRRVTFEVVVKGGALEDVEADLLRLSEYAKSTTAIASVRALGGIGLAHACPELVALGARFEGEKARRTFAVRCFDLDAETVEAHAKEHGHDATYALMCSGEHAAFEGST